MASPIDSKSSCPPSYGAVVIGGGPGGITVVGNLLEQHRRLPERRQLWVDPHFQAGRVNASYREVPSNTTVKLFLQFAEAVEPFRQIVSTTPEPNAVTELRGLPQDKTCSLHHAANMCLMLTDGLSRHPDVQQHKGKVTAATLDQPNKLWRVMLDGESTVTTSNVVLCTGSSPISEPLPMIQKMISQLGLHMLHLDTALMPSILAKAFDPNVAASVAVIGASHSAILVLMNLYTLTSSTHPHLRIRWFTRNKLRYAEHMDGWILRDNTGLKGQAAQWARKNLEDETFPKSPVSQVITKIWTPPDEEQAYQSNLAGCTHIIQAVGYTRDPIPPLAVINGDGEAPEPLNVEYDHLTGCFFSKASPTTGRGEREHIPGLFGAGIAFPERVTDPYGNVENAVGFWKFMRFAKRVTPEWVSATQNGEAE